MYRTVDAAFWSDPTVKKLDPESKLLFLYLITNPHTHLSGIYYLPRVTMAYETGIDSAKLGYPIDRVSGAGLARFDAELDVVWVVNMFRYQGTGPKAISSASMQLKTLHKSALCKLFAERYPSVLSVADGYRIDTLSIGYPPGTELGTGKEQETEQERETPPPCENFSETKTETPTSIDGNPNDPNWLALQWRTRLRRNPNKNEDLAALASMYSEWMEKGVTGQAIMDDILKKQRLRTEAIWDQEKRFFQKKGTNGNHKTITEAERRRAVLGHD